MDTYREACAEVAAVWAATVGADGGPFAGSRLVALVTPQGWCGHVELPGDLAVSAVTAQEAAIAAAYRLPAGSVATRTSGEGGVFVWAYRTAGGGDYHLSWPEIPLDGSEYADLQRESAGTSLLDLVRLTAWARAYQESWAALRTGREVDMHQVVRRYTRLRAGVLDLLARTSSRQVRDLLLQVGVSREALPDDIATAIDYPRARDVTIPIPVGPRDRHAHPAGHTATCRPSFR